ncbi:MAG: tyrosine-type recombinase/integrase [Streptosporangiaceae bacterium]
MDGITYDVRLWKTEVYKGSRVTTYKVRWTVSGKPWKESFRRRAQADSFRAELLAAARRGEAFSLTTGRPVSWKRSENTLSWYAFAVDYVDAKWPYASANHRRGIAEALTDATEVLLAADPIGMPLDLLRTALRTWAFSARIRDGGQPPEELAAAVAWLERNTVALRALTEPGKGATLVRAVLDRISRKRNGTPAAANTATRKRMVINNAMEYACEIGALPANPLKTVKWTKPRTVKTLDMRIVVNAGQARALLDAVRAQGDRGERMVAFFACLYYAALRPEEAVDLRREHLVSLPADGWGEMRLTHAEPRSGTQWTNNGHARERRELKHRAQGETRSVPIHPDLAVLLRAHLDRFGTDPRGRLFVGPRGGVLTDRAYLAVWHKARERALTKREVASTLARTPYALRHAAVSTWLSAGVPPQQVAEWAGHSVDVLLRVYAKCVAGHQDEAKQRILKVTQPHDSGEK